MHVTGVCASCSAIAIIGIDSNGTTCIYTVVSYNHINVYNRSPSNRKRKETIIKE